MGYSVTSTGIDFTRGRGAAKVVLSISFRELETWAKRQRVETEKLMQRSFGRACSGLKKKFVDVMKNAGGVQGVPKFRDFEDFTKQLRVLDGKSDRPMGGVLADPHRIVAFKQNGYQVIGWPDAMSELAMAFQEGRGIWKKDEDFTFWPSTRYALHKKGIRDIPRVYAHNSRCVIPEPFGHYVKAHLEEWARGAFYKELAKQMQKGAMP